MKHAAWLASFAALLGVGALVAWSPWERSTVGIPPPPSDRAPRESTAESDHSGVAGLELAGELDERVELRPPTITEILEAELLSEGAPLEPFHGRLLYESTGQGVPWFGVMLRGVGRQVEFCTTDAEGRFRSRLSFPLARTLVLAKDARATDWDEATEVRREAGGTEWIAALPAEPTFLIAGDLPAGLDGWTLQAMVPDPRELGSWTGVRLRRGGDAWFVREVPWAPRESEGEAAGTTTAPPWELTFEADFWKGTALLDRIDGVIVATPQWECLGDVELAIHGAWTKPPRWRLNAELLPQGLGGERQSQGKYLNEGESEPLRFVRVRPGSYRLRVECPPCEIVELPVLVRQEQSTLVDVTLACPPVVGSVRGEVTTDSGEAPLEQVGVTLYGPSDLFWEGELVPDANSQRWRATFEIADVPGGEYQLYFRAFEHGVHPSNSVSARAGDFVRFRVRDRPTLIDLGFRVFDAGTGTELATFDVSMLLQGRTDLTREAQPSGAIVLPQFPETAPMPWSLSSPGYRCAEGNLADQPKWSRTEGSRRWLDVHLQPGWSLPFHVYDDGSHPLEGVSILVDGVEQGRTDAAGYFLLTLPERPRSIEVRYRDWRLIERGMSPLEEIRPCELALFTFEHKL